MTIPRAVYTWDAYLSRLGALVLVLGPALIGCGRDGGRPHPERVADLPCGSLGYLVGVRGESAYVACDSPSGLRLYSVSITDGASRQIGADRSEPGKLHALAVTPTAFVYKRDTRMLPRPHSRGVAAHAIPLASGVKPRVIRGWGSDIVAAGSVLYWTEPDRGLDGRRVSSGSDDAIAHRPTTVVAARLAPDGRIQKRRALARLTGDLALGACDVGGVYVRRRQPDGRVDTLRVETTRRQPLAVAGELWCWPHSMFAGRRTWVGWRIEPNGGGADVQALWTSTDNVSANRALVFAWTDRPVALVAVDNAGYVLIARSDGHVSLDRVVFDPHIGTAAVCELARPPIRDQVFVSDKSLYWAADEICGLGAKRLQSRRVLWRCRLSRP